MYDIVKLLKIKNSVEYFQSSFNRPNLFYEVKTKERKKDAESDIGYLL